MPNTATKAEVLRDLEEMSGRVSTIVRSASLGVLAIGWGFIITPNQRLQIAVGWVLVAIALAFLALACDWLQYLAGYLNSVKTFDDLEAHQDELGGGWTPNALYRWRERIFYAKQASSFAGVIVLVGAMAPAIVRLLSQ